MKSPILLGIILVATIGCIAWFMSIQTDEAVLVTNFEECAAAGYPIMESYPEQCRTPDGRNFVRDISGDETGGNIVANGCAIAGCSSQLCISAEEAAAGGGVSTCEFRAEYACYREASCEPQANGKCGWTQTAELTQCLANPPAMEDSAPQVY